MCKITYDHTLKRWYSADGKPVVFQVKTAGFAIELDNTTTVDLFIKGREFWITDHSESEGNTFNIFESFKGDVQLWEFEIDRGHPAYEFFKKEMTRDGYGFFKKEMIRDSKVYLKPLDTTDDWQRY